MMMMAMVLLVCVSMCPKENKAHHTVEAICLYPIQITVETLSVHVIFQS